MHRRAAAQAKRARRAAREQAQWQVRAGASSGASGSAGADAGCTDVLNDQKNCGWCGHDCGAVPYLQGYLQPEELSAIDWAYDFAISADSIFIAGGIDHFFYKLPKAGGSYQKWTGSTDILPMALNESYVYFSEYDAHVLWRASTAGTLTPTQLLTANAPVDALLVDATGIYYYEYGLQRIRRASLAGTGSVDFATNIYNVWWLVSDATHIYAGSVLDGIYRFDKNATTPIVVDDSYFFHDIFDLGPRRSRSTTRRFTSRPAIRGLSDAADEHSAPLLEGQEPQRTWRRATR
jgi:hypothetical protein